MTIEDLLEIRAIEQLKYRYLRHVDLKQFDEVARTFTDDATASYGGGAYSFSGRDAIVGFLRQTMSRTDMHTSHKVHHPEIELTGPDTATGTWALEDRIVDLGYNIDIGGAAYYFDEFRKVDGEWLISHTGYRRVYEEIQPRADNRSLTASWWGTDGRSELPSGVE